MKKSTLFTILSLLCISLFGQTSGGPDPYGYTWKNSDHGTSPPAFNWFDITTIGTQVVGLSDDNVVGPFNASNGFQFYWYNTSEFYIGSNGYITFSGDNIASPFPASVPLTTGSNDWIAPFLSDLNFYGAGNTGKVYYYSNTDTLCVSFIDVPFWVVTQPKYTGSNTFQIILNKADKSITYNYLSTDMGVKTSLDNTIGFENNSGTLGLSSLIDSLPHDSLTIKFYYPASVTYQAVDGGVAWNDNVDNGGIFIKSNSKKIPIRANIKNFGNTNLSSFIVYDTIFDDNGSVVSSGLVNVNSLASLSDVTVTFPDSFTTSTAGNYTLKTTVSGINGDTLNFNDELLMEIIALDTTKDIIRHDYSDGSAEAGQGWNGGDGGIGIYIRPAIYPALVVRSRYFIESNASVPAGFHAMIFDDDGPGGSRGSLIDSVFIPGNTISTGVYTNVTPINQQIVIDSGAVYLVWLMDSADIDLGRDFDAPYSRRTYEILGPGWSGYRRKLTEDFLMGIDFDYPWPNAYFKTDNNAEPEISFIDTSQNSPTTWLWNFGDGGTSTQQSPTHIYTLNGTYNVCLTASNAYGSDSICKPIVIDNISPIADFSWNQDNSPLIAFTDLSGGPPTSWNWNFGDGTSDTIQHPSHTFNANGVFEVCLKVSNINGLDSTCKDVIVTGIGLEELNLDLIKIFPNPSKGIVTLNFGENVEEVTYYIVNSSGQQIVQPQRLHSLNSFKVDISNYPGINFIHLEVHGSKKKYKILIEP